MADIRMAASAFNVLQTVQRLSSTARFKNPAVTAAGGTAIGTITGNGNTQPPALSHNRYWTDFQDGSLFLVTGGVPTTYNPGGFPFVRVPCVTEFPSGGGGNVGTGSGPTINASSWRVEFNIWGDKVAIHHLDNGNAYRYLVDDYDGNGLRYISRTATTGPNTGGIFYSTLDFSSPGLGVRERKIVVEGVNAGAFRGASTAPTHRIFPTSRSDLLRMIVMGDSITDGIGATYKADSFTRVMGDCLGIRDVWCSGLGGAGYLNTVSGTKSTIRTRIADMTANILPGRTIVAFHTGRNDLSSSTSAVQTEVSAVLSAARLPAGMATVPIFVFGSHQGQDTSINALVLGIEAAAKAAVDARSTDKLCSFIPVTSKVDPMISGTGKVGATTGDGNADIWVGTDAVHYSDTGHLNFGMASADDLLTSIETMITR